MNEALFQSPEALTFDDVLVVPAYSEILPAEVSVQGESYHGLGKSAIAATILRSQSAHSLISYGY